MNASDFNSILQEVSCKPYSFEIIEKDGHCFLMARFFEVDVETYVARVQSTRKWYLSPHMTKSEFVQTCLKCVLTAAEHEAREAFQFKGKRVFGPHFDVEVLHAVCDQKEVRDELPKPHWKFGHASSNGRPVPTCSKCGSAVDSDLDEHEAECW